MTKEQVEGLAVGDFVLVVSTDPPVTCEVKAIEKVDREKVWWLTVNGYPGYYAFNRSTLMKDFQKSEVTK